MTGAPWTDISVYDNKILVLKLYYAGIPTQQARETGAPSADTAAYTNYNIVNNYY